jgi:hypothetical protein
VLHQCTCLRPVSHQGKLCSGCKARPERDSLVQKLWLHGTRFVHYVCSREGDHSTTIFSGEADTGNMCWAAIAMARAYHFMGKPHYLHGARTVADWVIKHTTVGSEVSSFGCISSPWSLALSLLSFHNVLEIMRLFKLYLFR